MSIRNEPQTRDDRRAYYDDFSARYDVGRDAGYHAFIDHAELDYILPRARGRRVLEAGCGTGLLLAGVAREAGEAVGVDLSAGMLRPAHERELSVAQGDLHHLPFADGTFDLVYSCKVLAHVPDLRRTLHELNRVTAPGGRLILEFYNRHSLRYLVRRLRPGMAVSTKRTDADVYTRFDTEREVLAAAPKTWRLLSRRGARVATLVPQLFDLPLAGPAWAKMEGWMGRGPAARLGGFLLLEFAREMR